MKNNTSQQNTQKHVQKNTASPRNTANLKTVWQTMCEEAQQACDGDEIIHHFYQENFINFKNNPEEGLASFLIKKLCLSNAQQLQFVQLFTNMFLQESVGFAVAADILAVCERDAACTKILHGTAFSKGLHALLCHRIAHEILPTKKDTSLYLQYLCCIHFSVDIHPAAQIAPGLFLDHGDSIVIGETCTIAEDVSILQDVTLGGTGKDQGDRHPKIEKGVLIGAGAKILGNIRIGKFSRIGASSVVLEDVPPNCTAVGVPARIIPHQQKDGFPSKAMDHKINS